MMRKALEDREETVPVQDMWRIPLLGKLLRHRYNMEINVQDTTDISDLIDSLCSS